MMLGRVGYIFRSNGITEIDPTGIGTAPFDFNHLWASQLGIGNIKYTGIAQYGTTGVFVSSDNIYSVQSYQISAIGGTARDAIYADLSLNSNAAVNATYGTNAPPFPQNVFSALVPLFSSGVGNVPNAGSGLNAGYLYGQSANDTSFIYLVYILCIPMVGGTKVWVYSFEDQNWTDFFLVNDWVTANPTVVGIPEGANQVSYVLHLLIPILNLKSSTNGIGIFDTNNFDDKLQGSSHSFKVEDIIAERQPTVRRVILTYRDLGPAAIIVTINGSDDNGTLTQVSTPLIKIGSATASGKLITKFVDITYTGFRPQLTIIRAPGGGPVSIATATMLGHVEKQTL